MLTELYTDRLTLRPWLASDEADLIRIAGQDHIEYWFCYYRLEREEWNR